MSFIHMADMHLCYRQYDLEQRFIDFGRTFKQIAEYAIASKVDFVLIAGDLFDKRSINAPTYVQAAHVLSMLREAGIPCVAIEGNHDRRFIKDGMSWLESLEWEGLIKVIKNYDGNLMGNFVDVGGTRIFGLGFAGSMTAESIPLVVNSIREINSKSPPEKTILMMHAGVQGKMKHGILGEVTYEDLYPLKEVVDYLALGHYHSAYDIDGWVYNPGSPDTCSIAEYGEPKGFYHVKDGKPELKEVAIRDFRVVPVTVDGRETADALLEDIEEKLARIGKCENPVVHIVLQGTLRFDKSHLNIDAIKALAAEKLNALHVEVRFDLSNDEFFLSRLESSALDRPAIEREVFRKLAQSDSMLAGNCDLFASSLSELKGIAVKGADEHTMDSVLRRTFNEIRSLPSKSITAGPSIAEPLNPAKKPGKKAQKPVQLALDLGDMP
jgi:DNA repair exonuclease SbcCD nuclease subunit